MKNIQYDITHSINIILNTNINICFKYSNVECFEFFHYNVTCVIMISVTENSYVAKVNTSGDLTKSKKIYR